MRNLRLRRRNPRFECIELVLRTRDVKLGRQPERLPLAREFERMLPDLRVVLQDLQFLLRPAQIDIRGSRVGREREPHRILRMLLPDEFRLRGKQVEPFTAEHIGRPAQREPRASLPHIAERRRRVLPCIGRMRGRIEFGQQHRALLHGQRLRLLHAFGCRLQIEVAVEHGCDQPVERGIVELRPPRGGVDVRARHIGVPCFRRECSNRFLKRRMLRGLHRTSCGECADGEGDEKFFMMEMTSTSVRVRRRRVQGNGFEKTTASSATTKHSDSA